MADKDVIEKVQKLVALGQSEDENEARNAARQAVLLMKEHRLVVLPADFVEKTQKLIDGAADIEKRVGERAERARNQGIMLGALGGWLAAKKF